MTILQIITSLRTGGAERLVVELSKRMAAAGDIVEVLLFDGTQTPLRAEIEEAGITVHSLDIGEKAMHNPLLVFRLRRFLMKHHYDIIHTHNTPCQFLTAAASICMRLPLVTTEHGTINRRRSKVWLKNFDRWMYSRYRHIVCVSEETRSNLSAWLASKVLDERMSVTANGIDFKRIENASPAADFSDSDCFKILMVSAFRPEKDQLTLIRAVGMLPFDDYCLFLAGGFELPEHQTIMETCRSEAKALGIESKVRFFGIRDDVPELMAAADVIVLSSHHEGMSLSLLEGMASGKPVVASDVQGMREVVGGAGVLFPEGDAEALADVLRQMKENGAYTREVAERCRERAGKFDIKTTADSYRRLYERLNID